MLSNVIPHNRAQGITETTITLTISLRMLESHYSHVKRSQQYKYCPPSRGPVLDAHLLYIIFISKHFACLTFSGGWVRGVSHWEHFMGLNDLEPWTCVTKMCEREFVAKMIMGYPMICDKFAWEQEALDTVHHLHVPGAILCLRCARNRSRMSVCTTCWVKSEKGRHPS